MNSFLDVRAVLANIFLPYFILYSYNTCDQSSTFHKTVNSIGYPALMCWKRLLWQRMANAAFAKHSSSCNSKTYPLWLIRKWTGCTLTMCFICEYCTSEAVTVHNVVICCNTTVWMTNQCKGGLLSSRSSVCSEATWQKHWQPSCIVSSHLFLA
jgi:hypothetical protein